MSVIYHHTSGEGLLGIVSRRALWATEIGFLNDYREYHHGMDAVSELCKSYACLRDREQDVARRLGELYGMIPKFLEDNTQRRQIFVASFTERRDDLRQWMSYGKPNSSYSIGFDEESLRDLSVRSKIPFPKELSYQLRNVAYGASNSIDTMLDPKNIVERLSNGDDVLAVAKDLVNELMFGCCSGKSKQFSDEGEVRLVIQTRELDSPYSRTEFRIQGGVIVPYIEIPIEPHYVKEIIVGPNVNSELAYKGVSDLLKSHGFSSVVSTSECTLRQY